MVLCILMMNLVYTKKIYALPSGVERVEIGNWTKTREVNEIGGDEKKLNSEVLSNIENINMGDDAKEVEIVDNVYNNINLKMKNIIDANNDRLSQSDGNEDIRTIKGGKVLRTRAFSSDPISFNYENIKSWIGSNESILWKQESLGSKFITWPCYVKVSEQVISKNAPIEWRMLEGKFQLSDEQINLIREKKVQPVIGIEVNNNEDFKLICPLSDIFNIFINGKFTDINYSAASGNYIFRVDGNNTFIKYKYISSNEKNQFCDKEVDSILSQHTNSNHIDFNILKDNYSFAINSARTDKKYYKMIGDISEYISDSTNQYTISLLTGQIGRINQEDSSNTGGISKINLYLIKNPEIDVSIKPYIIKNEQKEYINPNYKFSYNEKIRFDVEITNLSDEYNLSDLNLNINIIKKVINSDKSEMDIFHIDKNTCTYKSRQAIDKQ